MQRGVSFLERKRQIFYSFLVALLIVLNIFFAYQLYRIYTQEQKAPKTAEERELYFYLDEVKKDPRNIEARVNLVLALIELNRIEDAERELAKARKLNDKDPRVYFAAATLEAKKGNHDKAIEYYRKVIEADPSNVSSRIELARALMKKKNFEEAIKVLEDTVKISPMVADVYYLLGVCYRETGETTKARENLMKALQFAPDFKEAREELLKLER